MAQNAFTKLLGAVKSRDWVAANEQFGGIMQQKVADRIQQERVVLGATLVKEASEEDEDVVISTDSKDDDKDDDKDKKPVEESRKKK